jgi:hypothetical protein
MMHAEPHGNEDAEDDQDYEEHNQVYDLSALPSDPSDRSLRPFAKRPACWHRTPAFQK